ncbi:glutamate--cysteine ligase regulatory subunit-like, partial [Brachionus plicatilis]
MTSRSEQTVDTGSRTVDPVIPKATSLLINSGNIVSADRLKKRSNTSPQDELVEVINGTFWSWLSTIDSNAYQEQNSVECRHPVFEKLKETEHDDISISVKLFLNSLDTEIVSQSIKKILDEIGAKHIDTLIVSFPDKVFVHDQLPAQLVMPVWSIVQECVDSQVVSTAGL